MSTTLSVRLPDDLAHNLEDIAKETKRSKSFHIQRALETYMENFADLQVALDRLQDQTDPIVSSEEMRKNLGI